jgi:hypothetical protein
MKIIFDNSESAAPVAPLLHGNEEEQNAPAPAEPETIEPPKPESKGFGW